MNKLSMLAAAMLLVIAGTAASAREFTVNGVRMSNVCSNAQGQKYTYDGFFGPVGSPCTWTIGGYQPQGHQYWGTFGG